MVSTAPAHVDAISLEKGGIVGKDQLSPFHHLKMVGFFVQLAGYQPGSGGRVLYQVIFKEGLLISLKTCATSASTFYVRIVD